MLKQIKKHWYASSLLALGGLSMTYLTCIAEPQYTSESIITIQSTKDDNPAAMSLGFLASQPGMGNDVPLATSYMASPDMSKVLADKIAFKEHLSSPDLYFWERLKNGATTEDYHSVVQNLIEANVDDSGSIISIKTTAFSPEKSVEMNKVVLIEVEKLINNLNKKKIEAQIEASSLSIKESSNKLQLAHQKLTKYQQASQTRNPIKDITGINSVVLELEAELAKVKTELLEKSKYLSDDSIEIKAIKQRLNALSERISAERSRLAGTGDNASELEYYTLKLEADLLSDAYKASIATHEQLKFEAQKDSKIVLVVSTPTLPEKESYPTPLVSTFKLLVIAAFILAIAKMFAVTILRGKK